MNCSQLQKFAEAYVDGEFDGFERAEIEAHLATCPDCRNHIATIEGFRLFFKNHSQAISPPPHFRFAVTALAAEQTARGHYRTNWVAFGLAAAVILALVTTTMLRAPSNPGSLESGLLDTPIIDASVNYHRRNLPVEVTGPDLSVIGQWFSNQVDFPVRLPTFRHESIHANLLGGRLSHLENQEAAQVVYEVDGSKLSVLMFRTPTRRFNLPVRAMLNRRFIVLNREGFNVAVFNNNGLTYSFTSTLPQRRLRELVQSTAFQNY